MFLSRYTSYTLHTYYIDPLQLNLYCPKGLMFSVLFNDYECCSVWFTEYEVYETTRKIDEQRVWQV